MGRSVLMLLVLGACSFNAAGVDDGPPGRDGDLGSGSGSGSGMGSGSGTLCAGPGSGDLFLCIDTPTDPLVLAGPIDTDHDCHHHIDQSAGTLCVIDGTDITTAATVTVTGSHPLVLFASGTIHITNLVDASSHPDREGPADDSDECGSQTHAQPGSAGGGGGAGGSFGTFGGVGGTGGGGAGGITNPLALTPDHMRRGCAGGDGGDGAADHTDGHQGHGGGAIYLLAGTKVLVDAGVAIDASGMGGTGARSTGSTGVGGPAAGKGGAGGGGSGGMIALFAPTVAVTGTLLANGGGGGEGGDIPHNCSPGADANPNTPLAAVLGGGVPTAACPAGGVGGQGAGGTNAALPGTTSTQGAGGGGGGLGIILLPANAITSGNTSPAQRMFP